MVSNRGYNRKSNTYHKHIGKCKIRADDLSHKYIMCLKWSQTIETLFHSDMRTMMSLIKNHANIDAGTVEWMHPLAFSSKSSLDDNPTWDEYMNSPHKKEFGLTCYKEINTLNKKHAWEVIDREDWMNVLLSFWDFKKNVTQTEVSANSKLTFVPRTIIKVQESIYLTPFPHYSTGPTPGSCSSFQLY